MNWYKKAQYTSDTYFAYNRPGDAVWVYNGNNLIVDYPSNDKNKMTHNKSFGPEGKNYFFKGRFNPTTKLVSITAHPGFLSSNQEYIKKQMEEALYKEFGQDINIKYF